MYRDSISGEIIYTPEDMLLFRESPFACWMERLSLEHPDHGIAPDAEPSGASPAQPLPWQIFVREVGQGAMSAGAAAARPEPAMAMTLPAGVAIAAHASVEERRAATLRAMRAGANSIHGAQLGCGPWRCSVDLLLRSDGESDLGDYRYLPCAIQHGERERVAFYLSAGADLLALQQGVLPPQLLIARPHEEMLALDSAAHIALYRALQQRFLAAAAGFHRECMPDPAESSHFGRWSRRAAQVLRERAAAGAADAHERAGLLQALVRAVAPYAQAGGAQAGGGGTVRGPAARAAGSR